MDVELVWPNKDLRLCATGAVGYKWLQPDDPGPVYPPRATVLHDTGMRVDDGGNLLVIGDALDGLEQVEAQNPGLRGTVRLVYIDPPFNTGKVFRQYGDAMKTPMWLSMLRDRLTAVRPLLADDASVWVHLDDSEVHHARAVLDEVFGRAAFVANVIWQKKSSRDSRAAFSVNHDNILVYAPAGPRAWKKGRNLLAQDNALLKNRDADPRGPWADAPFTAPGFRANQQYDIVTPTGAVHRPPRGRSWYATEPTFRDLLADGRIWFPRDGAGLPRIKMFADQLRGLVPFSVWGVADTGTNDDAKRHLLDMFPDKEVFDTPKPEALLEQIIHIATKSGELVVDLFAGSGTTAAVAHKMGRRWLAIERSVDVVTEFTLPRLTQVVAGTDTGGITAQVAWRGGSSFSVIAVEPRLGTPPATKGNLPLRRGLAALRKVLDQQRPAATTVSDSSHPDKQESTSVELALS